MRLFMIKLLLIFIFIVFASKGYAQSVSIPLPISNVETKAIPVTSIADHIGEKPGITAEDEQIYAGQILHVNLKADFKSKSSEDGDQLVWRHLIENNAGKQIVLYFDTLLLAEKSTFFLIDMQSGQVLVSIGPQQTHQAGVKILGPFSTSRLLLQLQSATDVQTNSLVMRDIGLLEDTFGEKGFGTSDFCEVNVNCPEGIEYQKQKRGIARILVKQGSGLFYCSGSLINNTKRDLAPLFLTANHCGRTSSTADYERWVFYFNYESQGCDNPANEPNPYAITGATLLAASGNETAEGSDFKLLKINQEIPAQIDPYFNGWSRLETTTNTGVCIHHPDGDVKKISTYTEKPISTSYGGGAEQTDEKYWRVQWAQTTTGYGVTEGGSSGSPLFDADGYIIGALTGGLATCDNPGAPDYYGKMSYSWASNGESPAQQLQPWLDPMNTGAERLGGIGHDMEAVIADFEADFKEIVVGQTVIFNNRSTGDLETYEWHFEGANEPSSLLESPKAVLYQSLGSFNVRLIVSNGVVSDTLLKEDYIRVLPSLYPNPTNGQFTIDFGKNTPEIADIAVFDIIGRTIPFAASQQESKLLVKIETIRNGIFIVKYTDQNSQRVLKFVKN